MLPSLFVNALFMLLSVMNISADTGKTKVENLAFIMFSNYPNKNLPHSNRREQIINE